MLVQAGDHGSPGARVRPGLIGGVCGSFQALGRYAAGQRAAGDRGRTKPGPAVRGSVYARVPLQRRAGSSIPGFRNSFPAPGPARPRSPWRRCRAAGRRGVPTVPGDEQIVLDTAAAAPCPGRVLPDRRHHGCRPRRREGELPGRGREGTSLVSAGSSTRTVTFRCYDRTATRSVPGHRPGRGRGAGRRDGRSRGRTELSTMFPVRVLLSGFVTPFGFYIARRASGRR